MKNLLLLLLTTFTLCSCDKDNDKPTNPIDQLPPATQIGANTFGCLLDGQTFIPSGGTNPLDCVYQFVDGGYYLAVQGNKRNENNNLIGISIGTNDLEIFENQTYQLLEYQAGNAVGGGFFNLMINYTSTLNTGELKITKLDTQNQIVSGLFWFDVKDQNGVIHQIREGRFDMQYTN